MPDISTMKRSKFLRRADCGAGILLTIQKCDEQDVAKEGDEPEFRWCLHFEEDCAPMVLNSTNAELIAQFTGERNTDNWPGKQIVAYDEPSVSYGGKLVGGIRVRAPKKKAASAVAAKPAMAKATATDDEEEGDDIPFN